MHRIAIVMINNLLIHIALRIITQWKMPGKEKLEIIESQFLSQYVGEYQNIQQ